MKKTYEKCIDAKNKSLVQTDEFSYHTFTFFFTDQGNL